jgi:hypothetical protein
MWKEDNHERWELKDTEGSGSVLFEGLSLRSLKTTEYKNSYKNLSAYFR